MKIFSKCVVVAILVLALGQPAYGGGLEEVLDVRGWFMELISEILPTGAQSDPGGDDPEIGPMLEPHGSQAGAGEDVEEEARQEGEGDSEIGPMLEPHG